MRLADRTTGRPGPVSLLLWLFDDVDADFGDAGFDHIEFLCSAEREVQDSAGDQGAAIVDAELEGSAVADVGDADNGAQREFTVRGRQAVHIEDLAIGGLATVKLMCVVGGEAHLICAFCRHAW